MKINPAYGASALLALIWGFNFLFVKIAIPFISPVQITLLRVVFGFFPIFFLGLATGALDWKHLRHLHHFFAMALFATAVFFVAFAKGTELLLSSVAGMLSGASPLFTFLAAWLFLRTEPLTAKSAAGTLICFFGILLIARPWTSSGNVNVPGVLYMLAGSCSFGLSFVYARKFISPLGISPVALATYQMGLAILALALVTDLHGITAIFQSPAASAGLIAGLGLAGTGLAYILYYFIVQKIGAVKASAVTYLPPVIALLVGVMLLGEPMELLDIIAMVAILCGVATVQSARSTTAAVGREHSN